MDLTRLLLLVGGAVTLVVWFMLPERLTSEWPLSAFLLTFTIAHLPFRIASMRRDPRMRNDWRAHWALPVMAMPFALMIHASPSALNAAAIVLGVTGLATMIWWSYRESQRREAGPDR